MLEKLFYSLERKQNPVTLLSKIVCYILCKKNGFKKLPEFSEEERNLFLWRGKRTVTSNSENYKFTTIMKQMQAVFQKKKHKILQLLHISNEKGGYKISLELASKLPDWQCRNYFSMTLDEFSDISGSEFHSNDLNSTLMDFEISEDKSSFS